MHFKLKKDILQLCIIGLHFVMVASHKMQTHNQLKLSAFYAQNSCFQPKAVVILRAISPMQISSFHCGQYIWITK